MESNLSHNYLVYYYATEYANAEADPSIQKFAASI